MAAFIVVETGITAGSQHPIEKPVIRIGSATQNDVKIPSKTLTEHALTLEYRDSGYIVHNRNSSTVTIGTSPLESGQAVNWPAGQVLKIDDGTQLRLTTDGDPTPRPISDLEQTGFELEEVDDVSQDLETSDEENSSAKPSRSKEMMTIGICAIIGLLLLMDTSPTKVEEAADSLPKIISTWQGELDFVRQLQHAQNELDAGNAIVAKQRFLDIRNQLLDRTGGLSGERSDEEERLLGYIHEQLTKLKVGLVEN